MQETHHIGRSFGGLTHTKHLYLAPPSPNVHRLKRGHLSQENRIEQMYYFLAKFNLGGNVQKSDTRTHTKKKGKKKIIEKGS